MGASGWPGRRRQSVLGFILALLLLPSLVSAQSVPDRWKLPGNVPPAAQQEKDLRDQADELIDSAPTRALALYEEAAGKGDAIAAYRAAIMYSENMAIRPNEARASALMKQAADAGLPAAMSDYGLLVYQGLAQGTPEDAANWFAKAAKAGDDQGKFFYAYSLAKGDGVAQSYEEAYYWLLLTKPTGIADYDKDVADFKSALEVSVEPAVLDAARRRAEKES